MGETRHVDGYSIPSLTGNEPGPTYRSDAKIAIQGLQALHSVTKVGISYRDYPGRLQDCRIIVDQFLNKYPGNHPLQQPVSQAMSSFEDALAVWRMKFSGDEVQAFVGSSSLSEYFRKYPGFKKELDKAGLKTEYGYHLDSVLSRLWARAGEQVDALQKAVNE